MWKALTLKDGGPWNGRRRFPWILSILLALRVLSEAAHFLNFIFLLVNSAKYNVHYYVAYIIIPIVMALNACGLKRAYALVSTKTAYAKADGWFALVELLLTGLVLITTFFNFSVEQSPSFPGCYRPFEDGDLDKYRACKDESMSWYGSRWGWRTRITFLLLAAGCLHFLAMIVASAQACTARGAEKAKLAQKEMDLA
ncbi:hypothetical protein B0T25DRAFT_564899 [Lasiosphaeria hispida]|uniref:Uncharacterized protein n=1 Tax=Lasiosphaeria hispida TaxID=260671 RepID=A0AAJ0HRE7_9PEZI|nr:hypothetical protein B0T25DRAFT_564899 [Lasiosphaeria hispida]